ncbi:unnamed protein product, partial [Polarella glacialis]
KGLTKHSQRRRLMAAAARCGSRWPRGDCVRASLAWGSTEQRRCRRSYCPSPGSAGGTRGSGHCAAPGTGLSGCESLGWLLRP